MGDFLLVELGTQEIEEGGELGEHQQPVAVVDRLGQQFAKGFQLGGILRRAARIDQSRVAANLAQPQQLREGRHPQRVLRRAARREIEQEKERAIAELRREAIELAIAGASKVIEKNLDDQANRKIVESFLSSIPVTETKRG